MEEKNCQACGMPLNEEVSCKCDSNKCYHCCSCDESCSCGCQSK